MKELRLFRFPSPTTVLWATSTKSVEMRECSFVFVCGVVGEGEVGVGAQACAVAALVCRASVLCRQERQNPFPNCPIRFTPLRLQQRECLRARLR